MLAEQSVVSSMMNRVILLTCEHAVSTIPLEYQSLFQGHDILNTHAAIDFGALNVAKILSNTLHYPLWSTSVSRLLIDCNRSLSHPRCFSTFSRSLPKSEQQRLIDAFYLSFREKVIAWIDTHLPVLHLSIHSFTPVLNGQVRRVDIGLLYDPKRATEKKLATHWKAQLQTHYHVRMNHPYQGISDGFVNTLRQMYVEADYLGFEIEINQNQLKTSKAITAVAQQIGAIVTNIDTK